MTSVDAAGTTRKNARKNDVAKRSRRSMSRGRYEGNARAAFDVPASCRKYAKASAGSQSAIGAKPQQPSGTGRGPRDRERALTGTGSGGEIRSAALDRFLEQTMKAWSSQRARRARNRKLGEARRAWHPNEGYLMRAHKKIGASATPR